MLHILAAVYHSIMKQFLYFSIFSFFLTGCEPVYFVDIHNQTQTEVIIQIGFDKAEFKKKSWPGRSLRPYLEGYPYSADIGPVLEVDTVNLIYTYVLPPDKFFPLENAIGNRPNFRIISSLLIVSSDSIFISNRTELFDAFIEEKTRNWILEVK